MEPQKKQPTPEQEELRKERVQRKGQAQRRRTEAIRKHTLESLRENSQSPLLEEKGVWKSLFVSLQHFALATG